MLVQQNVIKEAIPPELLVIPPEPDLPNLTSPTAIQIGQYMVEEQAWAYQLEDRLTAIKTWSDQDVEPPQK
jgi:hypothetical protein